MRMRPHQPASPDLLVSGAAILYRLFDIGYAIDLERIDTLFAAEPSERTRPARDRAVGLAPRTPRRLRRCHHPSRP